MGGDTYFMFWDTTFIVLKQYHIIEQILEFLSAATMARGGLASFAPCPLIARILLFFHTVNSQCLQGTAH